MAKLLCSDLPSFVLWIPWRRCPGAETCSRNVIRYVWFFVAVCASVGYCNHLYE